MAALAIWSALRASYRRARRRWSIDDAYAPAQFVEEARAVASALAERARLDRLVDTSALAATALGMLGFAGGLIAGSDPPGQLAGHAAGVAALIGIGGVF